MANWSKTARPDQLPPEGEWLTWLVLAGRGWGKTRTGVELVNKWAREDDRARIAIVCPTASDTRDVAVEGVSGICTLYPDVHYEATKRRVTWPNGAVATLYSSDVPDRLRGPEHSKAWCDELASWRRPEAYDMLRMGLRVGKLPQLVITTTPRPTPIIRELVKDDSVVKTKGSTYDNLANLAPAFADEIRRRYEGTRLGRQELHAELLEDSSGALWDRETLDGNRVGRCPELMRVVVAIDPASSAKDTSDETGIIVAGIANGHGYILDDCSGRYSPDGWANRALNALEANQGDRIIAEVNNGGDMVAHTLRTVDRTAPLKMVHASKGKRVRAEPIAALYEQHKIHHVGIFPELEDQLCMWDATDGSKSPDRLDALVWAMTELCKPTTPSAYGKDKHRRRGLPTRRL